MYLRAGLLTISRNVATMASPRAPAQPLLVVLGSTGTGKSELAVELAIRFRGEIINTDAMQLYNGLPIITNKMPEAERKGVPHHLLGNVSLDDVPWDMDDYKREAKKIIREIRSRGSLPILVGGTQYYVNPLLFEDVTLDNVEWDTSKAFPILDEPSDVLLRELRKVDPVMADRWHPNDRRKIRRSLETYLRSGKPASQYYAEQRERRAAAKEDLDEEEPWEKLLFWVYSEDEVLKERLNRRVDKMLDGGLLDEIRELRELKRSKAAAGEILDMTKGIWQSIGYRQFEPYLAAADDRKEPASERLKWALEDTKAATRRYARAQTRWIRLKQIPLLKERGPQAMGSLYVLDSTDPAAFGDRVVEPAAAVTARFLSGEARPAPAEIPGAAAEVLARFGDPPPKEEYRARRCEACEAVLMTEGEWTKHVQGAAHRRVLKKKKKRALVPVDGPSGDEGLGNSGDEGLNGLDGIKDLDKSGIEGF